jgi:regulator of sigma E protease
MSGLIMAGQLILALAILVTFHELGHYLAARAFGIRVEKFYLFFDAWGKKLFSFKKGDTEYGIGWLPLGGYVKISGMIDESMDKEQMKKEPEPWEFRSKPAWQRFIVMIGGIVMNVILGYLFYTMYFTAFEKSYVPVDAVNQDGIVVGEIGEQIGLQNGDKLLTLNGNSYERFTDYIGLEAFFDGELGIERNGEKMTITVPKDFFQILKKNKGAFVGARENVFIRELPGTDGNAYKSGLREGDQLVALNDTTINSFPHLTNLLSNHKSSEVSLVISRDGANQTLTVPIDSGGKIGFYPSTKSVYTDQKVPYTLGSALNFALKDSWHAIYYNVVGIGKMFGGDIPVTEMRSVVGMAEIYGAVWDWGKFWRITAMISLALAFMNILPIPALDGGHMVFLIYEMIVGKPAPERVLMVAQYFGMAILLTLMVLLVGNDIWRIISN